jgi:hypothetical protein
MYKLEDNEKLVRKLQIRTRLRVATQMETVGIFALLPSMFQKRTHHPPLKKAQQGEAVQGVATNGAAGQKSSFAPRSKTKVKTTDSRCRRPGRR